MTMQNTLAAICLTLAAGVNFFALIVLFIDQQYRESLICFFILILLIVQLIKILKT